MSGRVFKNTRKIFGISIALLLVVFLVAFIVTPQESNDPNIRAISVTQNILDATNELKTFLEQPVGDNKSSVKRYISYMDVISDNCSKLKETAAGAEKAKASSDTLILLKNSESLCKDLLSMTTVSNTIYSTTLPVVSDSSRVKKYQTIPFIKSRMVEDAKKDVDKAINELRNSEHNDEEYVKLALEDLKNLKAIMDQSRGFDYLTALGLFQTQHIADRQQYWTGYGDIDGLTKALENQLIQFCNNSPSDKPAPSECVALEDN